MAIDPIERDPISRERERSLKSVQLIFGVLALVSLAAALVVAARGIEFGLPEGSTATIAYAFLFVGIVDTALLFVWERIFSRMNF